MEKKLAQHDYDSLAMAHKGLMDAGYKENFNLEKNSIYCPAIDIRFNPDDFEIDQFYRFEGMSDPGDNSVIYAISGKDGTKGTLIDAYGAYSEEITPELAKKLTINHPT